MKKYQCYKIVHGGKIIEISRVEIKPIRLMIENHGPLEVSDDYIKKHEPRIGGYYVLYEDGYESFSPAEAFENGYKEIE